jgi:outer membrane protein assembly factor BamB
MIHFPPNHIIDESRRPSHHLNMPKLLIIITAALTTFASAEDWTQFRGPEGNGHTTAKNLPLTWSDTKNVTWKVPISGLGWSSPLHLGGKIYLTTAVPKDPNNEKTDRSLRALCINAQNGQTLWDVEIFTQDGATTPDIHKKNSHATPTPIIEDSKIYVHFAHEGTACLDLFGKPVWKNRDLKYTPVHGGGGSPIIHKNLLIFHADAAQEPAIYALNKKTGKITWKTDRSTDAKRKFSFSTPIIIDVAGQPQLISAHSGAVCAYDPDNGKELWRVNYGEGYSVVPRPVYGNGIVYVCTGYDRANLLAIRVDEKSKGDVTASHVEWEQNKRIPLNPSPLLIGNELYFVADNGTASCVDAKSGDEHWQERVGGGCSASPLYDSVQKRIYFQDEQGLCTVVAAGKDFKKLSENEVLPRTFANFAPIDGAIFIRSESFLYRIEEK